VPSYASKVRKDPRRSNYTYAEALRPTFLVALFVPPIPEQRSLPLLSSIADWGKFFWIFPVKRSRLGTFLGARLGFFFSPPFLANSLPLFAVQYPFPHFFLLSFGPLVFFPTSDARPGSRFSYNATMFVQLFLLFLLRLLSFGVILPSLYFSRMKDSF